MVCPLYGNLSPAALPTHERLFLDSEVRSRLRSIINQSNKKNPPKLSRPGIEDALMRKGKLQLIRQQKLKEKVEAEKLKELQEKPVINKKSLQIMKNKRINQGNASKSSSKLEEPLSAYKEPIPKESLAGVSQTGVGFDKAAEYKRMFEARRSLK